MKDLSKLKMLLDLSDGIRSDIKDKDLEDGIKKATRKLVKENPGLTFEDILMNLVASIRESCRNMLGDETMDSVIDSMMKTVDLMADEEGDVLMGNEREVLRVVLRSIVIRKSMERSFKISVKAANEEWTGMKGTEL